MTRRCGRKEEVRASLALGHWPAACAAGLHEHVEACEECRAQVAMTLAMRNARAGAMPQLPAAELVWWRAQLRRRQEAMEQVRRPVWRAQIFAIALTLCAAAGLVLWQTLSMGWSALPASQPPTGVWVWALAGAAVLLLSGVAVYLMLEAE